MFLRADPSQDNDYVVLAIRSQARGVGSGHCRGTERQTRRVAGNGGDGIFVTRGIRRGIVKIPNPAVHAGIGRQSMEWTQPVEGDELFF